MTTSRKELLQFDGVGRNILERRIVALVKVLDAAAELLVAADDRTNGPASKEKYERYGLAWEELRSALKAV